MRNESTVRQSLVGGVALLVFVSLAVLIHARLTMFDPFSAFFKSSRMLSDGAAFVYLAIMLSALASVLVRCYWLEFAVMLGVGVICLSGLWAWDRVGGADGGDVVRLCVGRHGWWIAVPMVLFLVVLSARRSVVAGAGWSWCNLWAVGAGSFIAGMVLYFFRSDGGFFMMAKVLLILMVPAIVLLATTLYYRGKRSWLVRPVVLMTALLPLAAATIR